MRQFVAISAHLCSPISNPREQISAFQFQMSLYIFPSPVTKLSVLCCVLCLSKENTLFGFDFFFLTVFVKFQKCQAMSRYKPC